MKDFFVSYYLGEICHQYVVEAVNEAMAIQTVLRRVNDFNIFHGFKIERYHQEW